MEFRSNQAIYMQIGDYICENILKKRWQEAEKIPSIREMAVHMEVNPNTVMRTYTYLLEQGIVYNQRGIGYFVAAEAYHRTKKLKTREFVALALPRIFREMDLLEISVKQIEQYYESYSDAKSNTEERS